MASSAAGRGGGAHKSAGEEASRGEILYQKSSPQPWEWKKCVKVPAATSDKDPVQGKEMTKGLGRSSEKAEEKQGKGRSCWGIEEEEKKEQLNSSSMGLKLGKRTYFEDGHEDCSSKMSSVQATSAPNAAEAAGPATTTTTTTPTKKGRGSSQTAVTPKCQVEGCKADLSGSKDYHRRHKVCEVHSKTPKNTVNGLEQRFCQQCSRFHLLSEFDEGKRSCRRRLAGHNERRRKPQPDALAAYNMGNVSSFQAAYQRLGVGSSLLMDSHAEALGYGASTTNSWRYGGSHHPQFLSKQLVENLSAEKLLLLLQNSKRSTGLPTISASTTNATATTTTTTTTTNNMAKQDQMKLTLSSSPGGGGGLSSAGESSRALSLLSSDAWTKSATPGYELTSSTTSTQQTATNNNTSQYLLTTTAASPAAVESKKPVHHHHQRPHHHHQPQDAIPISSSSSKVAHHQQQQQTYASPLGSSGCWKFSGSSSSGY